MTSTLVRSSDDLLEETGRSDWFGYLDEPGGPPASRPSRGGTASKRNLLFYSGSLDDATSDPPGIRHENPQTWWPCMGILQQFFQNVFQQSPFYQDYAATRLAKPHEDLEAHLAIATYGDFRLTDAVRPSLAVAVEPRQGYRHDVYRDEDSGKEIPVIMAAASQEVLFGLFMQLVSRLGQSVDVVLESSHDHTNSGHVDFYREQIDMPVLGSALWDYEELLLNDGCTGIAVLNPATPQEVQFDEHKLLIVYGSPLEPFEYILEENGVPCIPDLAFITEAEHVHTSSEDLHRQFDRLRNQLGIDADFGSIC